MLAIIYQSDHLFICVMVSFIYVLSFEVLVTFIHLLISWFIGCLFMVLSSFLSINEFISFCHLLPSLRHSFNCLNGGFLPLLLCFFVHLMNEWLNLPISPKGPKKSVSHGKGQWTRRTLNLSAHLTQWRKRILFPMVCFTGVPSSD